jgi:hypothetical protein
LVGIGTFGHQKFDDHSLIILHRAKFELSANVVQLRKSVLPRSRVRASELITDIIGYELSTCDPQSGLEFQKASKSSRMDLFTIR